MQDASRRSFLRKAAGFAAAGLAFGGGLARGGGPKNYESPAESNPPDVWKRLDQPYPIEMITHPRYEPEKKYSLPPPTMGKQMGSVETPGVPPLGYELDGDVKVFTLIAQPVWQQITENGEPKIIVPEMKPYMTEAGKASYPKEPARPILGWGYNGSIPGPTIECTEGDRIRVVLKNELPEPTSIHWHGLEVPNHMDGAAPETQKPVMPGETFEYEFPVYQAGTMMYYSGYNFLKQVSLGLAGGIAVQPLQRKVPLDRDYMLFHQEWVLNPSNPNPVITSTGSNYATANGKCGPYIPPLNANEGEVVRIRNCHVGKVARIIHLHGMLFSLMNESGGSNPDMFKQPFVASVSIVPGTVADMQFAAWNPGVWRLVGQELQHTINAFTNIPIGIRSHGGMFTIVNVKPRNPNAPWRHPRENEIKNLKQQNQVG